MLLHHVVGIGFHFDDFVIHILARGQHHRRINFQRDGTGAVHDQDHAHGLSTTAALLQLRLVGFRAVRDGNQHAVGVIQANLTDPEAAFAFRDNLFSDNLAAVCGIHLQRIQRGTALFAHQFGLRRIGRRQNTAAVTHRHLGNLQLGSQGRGIGQLCRALIGQ
ncbi:hypothetical protein NB703_004652 [Pantoea ananatis]|uniref:Uncharacterized protein n=1 Tax=Pantoea ananas TaxID=553 RepID=A0AAJ1FTJ2_PANAN|nr:hypothetical protein [Pantoea ananatis]MCW0346559.1 hypothetical protein [Pantoea ananatis]